MSDGEAERVPAEEITAEGVAPVGDKVESTDAPPAQPAQESFAQPEEALAPTSSGEAVEDPIAKPDTFDELDQPPSPEQEAQQRANAIKTLAQLGRVDFQIDPVSLQYLDFEGDSQKFLTYCQEKGISTQALDTIAKWGSQNKDKAFFDVIDPLNKQAFNEEITRLPPELRALIVNTPSAEARQTGLLDPIHGRISESIHNEVTADLEQRYRAEASRAFIQQWDGQGSLDEAFETFLTDPTKGPAENVSWQQQTEQKIAVEAGQLAAEKTKKLLQMPLDTEGNIQAALLAIATTEAGEEISPEDAAAKVQDAQERLDKIARQKHNMDLKSLISYLGMELASMGSQTDLGVLFSALFGLKTDSYNGGHWRGSNNLESKDGSVQLDSNALFGELRGDPAKLAKFMETYFGGSYSDGGIRGYSQKEKLEALSKASPQEAQKIYQDFFKVLFETVRKSNTKAGENQAQLQLAFGKAFMPGKSVNFSEDVFTEYGLFAQLAADNSPVLVELLKKDLSGRKEVTNNVVPLTARPAATTPNSTAQAA